MNPSDFTNFPWDSVFQKTESEMVAQNIMKILTRTGNVFKDLSFEEYKQERLKDGHFTEIEEQYFNKVIDYCKSADTAKLFSRKWNIK
jgi:hypothetical protein